MNIKLKIKQLITFVFVQIPSRSCSRSCGRSRRIAAAIRGTVYTLYTFELVMCNVFFGRKIVRTQNPIPVIMCGAKI
jgi:hypothetical protein